MSSPRYVIDRMGIELHEAPNFYQAVAFVKSLTDTRGIRVVNYDQADEGDDGLTDGERERLEQLL